MLPARPSCDASTRWWLARSAGTSDGSTALIVPTTMKNAMPVLRHHRTLGHGRPVLNRSSITRNARNVTGTSSVKRSIAVMARLSVFVTPERLVGNVLRGLYAVKSRHDLQDADQESSGSRGHRSRSYGSRGHSWRGGGPPGPRRRGGGPRGPRPP